MTFSMTYYTKQKASILADFLREIKNHKERLASLQLELSTLEHAKSLADLGLDQEKIAKAKYILHIRGVISKAGRDKDAVIQHAIEFVVNGEVFFLRNLLGQSLMHHGMDSISCVHMACAQNMAISCLSLA